MGSGTATDCQRLAKALDDRVAMRGSKSGESNRLFLSAREPPTAARGRSRKDQPVVTMADVAEATGVSERTVRRRAAASKAEKPVNDRIKDPFDHEIPPVALAYWNRRGEVSELVKLAKQLAHKIKAPNRDDPLERLQ
jgi:hypothetical protein